MMKRIVMVFVTYCAALVFLVLAFVTGAQESFFWGAISFLSFFMVGVMLFHHGLRIWRENRQEKKRR
jgi:peptidoglycan/LPS O-acetylase OafA/YrhL